MPGKRARRVREGAVRKRTSKRWHLARWPTSPGVTTGQEVRESRNEGEGGQVIGHSKTWEVCEIAERRDSAGCPP